MTKYYTTPALHWQAAIRLVVTRRSLNVTKGWKNSFDVNICYL